MPDKETKKNGCNANFTGTSGDAFGQFSLHLQQNEIQVSVAVFSQISKK